MRRTRVWLPLLLVAMGCGPGAAALAQPGDSGTPSRELRGRPLWLSRPMGAEISAARPARALAEPVAGGAVLDCRVGESGGLADCKVATEAPAAYGYGAAALRLADRFRMAATTDAGEPTAGARVRVPVTFNASRVGGPMTVMAHPVWAQAASVADVSAAYPPAAGGVAGEAVVRCAFDIEGRATDCAVASEKPEGRGFGLAALSLTDDFVVVHAADEADILPGVVVDIPIAFRRPDDPARRPPADPQWLVSLTPAAAESLFPPAALEANTHTGRGLVNCVVARTGRLDDCRVSEERPPRLGFGEAAVQASKLLVMNPWSEAGEPFAGHRVAVPIRLELKVPPLIGEPVWLRKPSERDMANLHPRGEKKAHMAGGAILNCIVKADGYLGGCSIQGETPKGYDFGAAVLELAPLFRMGPTAKNGRPTAGRRVLVDVAFEALP